jgi:hypothetical protein
MLIFSWYVLFSKAEMEVERKKAEEEERKRRELEKAKQVGKYHLRISCLFLICFVLF